MRGNAFRSVDNGESWQQVNTGTTQALSGITQLADGRVVAVGMSGTVTVSKDGGRTFESSTRADRQNLTGIAAAANGKLVLLGQSGVLSDVLRP
jgi:X-X-X-Leu-X-X-Gly heptad repeat protein